MKNKKWYIIVKYWIDEANNHFRINHWTVLTSNKNYDKVKGESHIEEIDPKDSKWMNNLKSQFRVKSKDGGYAFIDNLEQCFDFIEKRNNIECWDDWEWSNGKYGNIDVEVDEE